MNTARSYDPVSPLAFLPSRVGSGKEGPVLRPGPPCVWPTASPSPLPVPRRCRHPRLGLGRCGVPRCARWPSATGSGAAELSDKAYQHWVHLWETYRRIAHPSRQNRLEVGTGSLVDPWESR